MEHGAAGTGYSLHPLNEIPTPRQVLGVGIWPGRTTGLNLKSKYGRYKGNQDLYHKDVAAKRSYYTEASADRAPETSSKSAMVEKTYGKYQLNPILGRNAMENTTLPDFIEQQVYAHMSISVAVGTAAQYRSAINITGPASEYLKKNYEHAIHNIRLHSADCVYGKHRETEGVNDHELL